MRKALLSAEYAQWVAFYTYELDKQKEAEKRDEMMSVVKRR